MNAGEGDIVGLTWCHSDLIFLSLSKIKLFGLAGEVRPAASIFCGMALHMLMRLDCVTRKFFMYSAHLWEQYRYEVY